MINLNEDSKRELLDKSKYGVDAYADQSKGKDRFQRRNKQKIANSNKEYNQIDMNRLFKEDIISFNIKVIGETDTYMVTLEFPGVIEELKKRIGDKPYETFQLGDFMRAVSLAFENNDIKVNCTCPDFVYRIKYADTQAGDVAGPGENRPAVITNPNDTKGRGCKHILKVLNNTSWIQKVASVIRNWIVYMQKHQENAYARLIFPTLYDQEYDKEYQLELFNDDELATDTDTIDAANKYAREKSQFKPLPKEEGPGDEASIEDIEGQQEFDFDSLLDDEEEQGPGQEEGPGQGPGM